MPDCFISYSSTDQKFANAIYVDLTAHGVTTFMAPVSVQLGTKWSGEILKALGASKPCQSRCVRLAVRSAGDRTRA